MRKSFLVGSASLLAIASPAWAQPAPQRRPLRRRRAPRTAVRAKSSSPASARRWSVRSSSSGRPTIMSRSISASDIGKLPDKNVADAVQRLPGVNTSSAASGEGGFDENDRVSIRGTSPSLTQVTIDGHAVSTGDWFILDQFSTVGRSTSFALLPSEMVGAVVVNKTQDASLLEGGVAGSIDLGSAARSISGPRSRSGLGPGRLQHAQQAGEAAGQRLARLAQRERARSASSSRASTSSAAFAATARRRSATRRSPPRNATGAAIPALIGVQAPTLIGSAYFQQKRTREGGVTTIDFKPSDRFEMRASGFYSQLDASNVNDNFLMLGIARGRPQRAHQLHGPQQYPGRGQLPAGRAVRPVRRPADRGHRRRQHRSSEGHGASSWFANLDMIWHASRPADLRRASSATPTALGKTPTSPFFEVDAPTGVSYTPSGNGYAVTTANINPSSPNGISNDFAINETFSSIDHEIYGKLDGSLEVGDGPVRKIDFGARIADHERKVDRLGPRLHARRQRRVLRSRPLSLRERQSDALSGRVQRQCARHSGPADPAGGRSEDHHQRDQCDPGRRARSDLRDRPAAERILARRIQGEGARHRRLCARPSRRRALARQYRRPRRRHAGETPSSTCPSPAPPAGRARPRAGANVVTTSAFGPLLITEVRHDYLDVLPSANLTFDLAPKLLLRLAAAETMARPDYSALGGTVSLTDTNFTGSGGNPNLKPIKATVLDGRSSITTGRRRSSRSACSTTSCNPT